MLFSSDGLPLSPPSCTAPAPVDTVSLPMAWEVGSLQFKAISLRDQVVSEYGTWEYGIQVEPGVGQPTLKFLVDVRDSRIAAHNKSVGYCAGYSRNGGFSLRKRCEPFKAKVEKGAGMKLTTSRACLWYELADMENIIMERKDKCVDRAKMFWQVVTFLREDIFKTLEDHHNQTRQLLATEAPATPPPSTPPTPFSGSSTEEEVLDEPLYWGGCLSFLSSESLPCDLAMCESDDVSIDLPDTWDWLPTCNSFNSEWE